MKREDFHELCQLIRVDSRQRVKEMSECRDKHRFGSFEQAKRTMSRDLQKVAKPYHCKTCGGFHVGNVVGTRRKRLKRLWKERHAEQY